MNSVLCISHQAGRTIYTSHSHNYPIRSDDRDRVFMMVNSYGYQRRVRYLSQTLLQMEKMGYLSLQKSKVNIPLPGEALKSSKCWADPVQLIKA